MPGLLTVAKPNVHCIDLFQLFNMIAGHPDHLQAAMLAKEAIRFRLKKRAKTEE